MDSTDSEGFKMTTNIYNNQNDIALLVTDKSNPERRTYTDTEGMDAMK